ncbi:MAG: hypothetical protein R2713_16730 [Ilumatobacteraceae bacterium]
MVRAGGSGAGRSSVVRQAELVRTRRRRAPRDPQGAGLIDQTSFAKFEITGPGALAAVQWLSVADMDTSVGTITYTQLCNERSGIECDLTMIRTAPDSWYVVTEAPRSARTTWAGSGRTRRTTVRS